MEMMNEGRVARKLHQQTDGQASLLLDRACPRVVYAGDDSFSSLLGGRLVCSCFSGGGWIS